MTLDNNQLFNLNTKRDHLINLLVKKLARLRSEGLQIQIQPLGFLKIPLKLNQKRKEDGQYLHAWIPGLPTQKGGPFIHTHVFKMNSRILTLKGEFFDLVYDTREDIRGEYQLISAVSEETTSVLGATCKRVNLINPRKVGVEEGKVYSVDRDVFHRTEIHGTALTLVHKYDFHDRAPLLAVPAQKKIMAEQFNHAEIDQAWAWDQVNKLLFT